MTLEQVKDEIENKLELAREQSRLALSKKHKNVASEWSKARSHYKVCLDLLNQIK